MLERVHFFIAYVGSAALVAFLAACMTSPRVATFACEGAGQGEGDACVLVGNSEEMGEAGAADLRDSQPPGPKLQDLGAAPTP